MKQRVLCDACGCIVQQKKGWWIFARWVTVGEQFKIYGHSYPMRWPDSKSAFEFINKKP